MPAPDLAALAARLPARPLTRFAPSPTGYLHLGHVANAVWTWRTADQVGARVILRMEDHDRTRSRPEYEQQIYDDLAWLGFEPTAESLESLRTRPSPFRQSDSIPEYQKALDALDARGLVYGCSCSRSDIARELGDGLVDGELRYPGTCRPRGLRPGPGIGARVVLPDAAYAFEDLALGHQHQRPQSQCGDLLARDRNGNWTYQFAVVVDDIRHRITHVIRGADLLQSTGRQLALARLLGRETGPVFLHHPIIHAESGAKLSKRDAALSLAAMRGRGMRAADVIEEAGRRTGLG
jgi:glutamyl-tRNA synthetase/glutamyl-Q tRNA(Asp) synthetase